MNQPKDNMSNDQLREQYDAILRKHGFVIDPDNWMQNAARDDFVALLESTLKQERKAYGGCINCYGKGYATVNNRWQGRNVSGGDNNAMKFCTCDRGKQLQVQFNKALKRERERTRACSQCAEAHTAQGHEADNSSEVA